MYRLQWIEGSEHKELILHWEELIVHPYYSHRNSTIQSYTPGLGWVEE
jgi:hypothetical protein